MSNPAAGMLAMLRKRSAPQHRHEVDISNRAKVCLIDLFRSRGETDVQNIENTSDVVVKVRLGVRLRAH